ncbi:hypothetical protein AMTR_s04427p00002440 [Amborella trichopoda]|uniref:Uncharacterized protein n=1 Tax=Amborella trichopoda TaxID=13333 RepID=U5D0M8_AMBTC|nr:hypothetical protein AMTR_s04427p00002440 [Amborella trichopoda]
MWLQKVYCGSASLYCRSVVFIIGSTYSTARSAVAPKSVLSERVLVLLECVSSLPEQPIQPSECFGSRRSAVEASPYIARARVLITRAFKWIAGVYGERVVSKSH